MAVCAHDVTFGDLGKHTLPISIAKALSNREGLVCDVVELQDDGIAFAAVGARVCTQELQQIGNPLLANDSLTATRPIDVKLSIRHIMRLRVRCSA
jgi:hypothetical protein